MSSTLGVCSWFTEITSLKVVVHRAESMLLVDNKYPKYVMSSFNQVFSLTQSFANLSYWFTSIIALKGPAFTSSFFFLSKMIIKIPGSNRVRRKGPGLGHGDMPAFLSSNFLMLKNILRASLHRPQVLWVA